MKFVNTIFSSVLFLSSQTTTVVMVQGASNSNTDLTGDESQCQKCMYQDCYQYGNCDGAQRFGGQGTGDDSQCQKCSHENCYRYTNCLRDYRSDIPVGTPVMSPVSNPSAAPTERPPFSPPTAPPSQNPDCDVDSNASVFYSDASNLLQSAVDGDHGYGMIFRDRYDTEVPCSWMDQYNVDAGLCLDDSGGKNYCNNDGVCGVAASYLHNDITVPNQVFMLTDGPYVPVVGYALVDNWSMNGGPIEGYAYYPTDSNSNDLRDWAAYGMKPGQGCHDDQQNFVCGDWDGTGSVDTCATRDSDSGYYCKCDYDNYSPEDWGWMVSQSFMAAHNPNLDGLPSDFFTGGAFMDQEQVSYMGMDYSSCWVEEEDFYDTNNSLDLITKAQNSLYKYRGDWWDNENDQFYDANNEEGHYQGWNEVSIDRNVDDYNQYSGFEALVVSLPTNMDSICDLDKETAQTIDDKLYSHWIDGYGSLNSPVVIMKNVEMDTDYYQKYFFAQNFLFESGNCIVDPDSPIGFNTYYFLANEEDPNSGVKYCDNF